MENVILSYGFPLIFLVLGILQTIYPQKSFMYGIKWMFTKESQLSDITIILIRITGVIILITSLILLIQGIREATFFSMYI